MNYLIVDDDIVFRSIIKDIIHNEKLGQVVGEASNGCLIDPAALNDTDVLITDLLMPERDGIETVDMLRSDGYAGKIIMISQMQDEEIIDKAYSVGTDYFLTKPINKLELMEIIMKV